MTDYQEISIILGQLRGLFSRADSMTKNGLDLSRQKIGSVLEDGAFVSLVNSEIGNWSKLVDKCIMLLPIAEGFERRLRPAEGENA